MITNAKEMLVHLAKEHKTIAQYAMEEEMKRSGRTKAQVREEMAQMIPVMQNAVTQGRKAPLQSVSGFTGGQAYQYEQYRKAGKSAAGNLISTAIAMAISCSETNAAMGIVIACPTAGSCGIVPAALLSLAENYDLSEETIIDGLFTAAGIGIIIGEHATVAGSEGGCQAECGSAGAMAAGAMVEMLGGTPEQAFHAGAMVLKAVMGLICDPVAGLVEIPCVKRNATGVANAIACADMVLAGVTSYIPFDEVVHTMYEVGKNLPECHRETGKGGIAITPTGLELAKGLK